MEKAEFILEKLLNTKDTRYLKVVQGRVKIDNNQKNGEILDRIPKQKSKILRMVASMFFF